MANASGNATSPNRPDRLEHAESSGMAKIAADEEHVLPSGRREHAPGGGSGTSSAR